MCGGTDWIAQNDVAKLGLSPRVRGNLHGLETGEAEKRSIPACAGEPAAQGAQGLQEGVYPRVCGGTSCRFAPTLAKGGLSPRVRGNHVQAADQAGATRSIPACAGGTHVGRVRTYRDRGLSPRVRGNPKRLRSCSATGLSPRVRGNRYRRPCRIPLPGSIPACAGEPLACRCLRPAGGVYPRVCGGTPSASARARSATGLSPRVRGNREPAGQRLVKHGSIPACAGEPVQGRDEITHGKVYPRVCGGTFQSAAGTGWPGGLSPRVRGNHNNEWRCVDCGGSIPACAGEPAYGRPRAGNAGVYPRVCGGTFLNVAALFAFKGLSPRVRGNRNASHCAA